MPGRLLEQSHQALLSVLEISRARGFLGPGELEPHVVRALAAADLIPPTATRALDLGSGGGLPGLPLAMARPDVHWTLLDGSVTRCAFLTEAVAMLGVGAQVDVLTGRAEEAGRGAGRGAYDVVVARSFGPPATTAECGAPFLAEGGRLIVAEPPGGEPDRWPAEGLRLLGLEAAERMVEPSAYQVLIRIAPCPDRFPRRVGVPAKRPLF